MLWFANSSMECGATMSSNSTLLARVTLPIAAAAVAAVVVTAPTAAADDPDAAYLKALHNHGIVGVNGGDSRLIRSGHEICGLLAGGLSMNAVIDALQLNEKNGATDDDMAFLVKVAAASYCPQYIK
jgi:hypothetical protein